MIPNIRGNVESNDKVPARGRCEYNPVKFAANGPALDGRMVEDLGAEVGLVPELGSNYRQPRRTAEASEKLQQYHYSIQWGGSNVKVPNDIRDGLRNNQHSDHVHRHFNHPGDTV